MFSKTTSFSLNGLIGYEVAVEVDIFNGLPSFDVVGMADVSVKEAKERVRSAIKNSGRKISPAKITVNLAPADIKKEGSHLDLAIAIGILKSSGQLNYETENYVFLGELSLNGELRPINGILPIIISAKNKGYNNFIIPNGNKLEASFIEGANVYSANTLKEVIDHLSGLAPIIVVPHNKYDANGANNKYNVDISFVKGQQVAKRALEIAVSGNHNILLVGPPGTGKTMLAKCLPTIMPNMTNEEALEVTKIHSVAGSLNSEEGIVKIRPFRTPHHTATVVSLIGGGKNIKPGEISLAHNGVLFLDEMPEYTRSTLEALRQPLEDGIITIARANGTITYPANFMLCGSMNPCPCGNYGSADKVCTCTQAQIQKYKSKISGPLLDRIDIYITVDNVKYSELKNKEASETSAIVRARVERTRKIQRERFLGSNILTNSQMGETELNKYCQLSIECEAILESAYNTLKLSARSRSRIIKIARTIADMEASEFIKESHILEAISYRQG